MSNIPWSEVSIYVGSTIQSLRLVIDGYEMPQDLALHFINGTLNQEHVNRITALLEAYRAQDAAYVRLPPPDLTGYRPVQMDEEMTSAESWARANAKAEEAQKILGEPEPVIIPTPEELGLNMRRLEYYRELYRKGVLNEGL